MLLGQLAEGMRAALASGDVEAARIPHETIGRPLDTPGTDAAGVIDLAAERSRRDVEAARIPTRPSNACSARRVRTPPASSTSPPSAPGC
ncbi:MAG TPA: hypothetical protein VL242_19055 [Sorangium sp.]|nr:hypothetical protein [Sorangium sp.]